MMKVLAIASTLAAAPAVADPILLMAEEDGCYWCARWHDEIAPIYPKTVEGRTAPLQTYDLHHETPDVVFDTKVRFTPTFILVEDGRELARIEGYPGEDFFWGLLSMMFEQAGIPLEEAS
ncbi:thioredoxin fold domain-containing protein [Roseobacteraceae bacterium S113]